LHSTTESGQVVAKMANEMWVVAKFSNRREFYAILNQKGSNVLEIDGQFFFV